MEGFHLKDVDPADTQHLGSEDKPLAKQVLAEGVEVLAPCRGVSEPISHTASKHSAWYGVPANNPSFTRLAVAVIDTLECLDLHYPRLTQLACYQLEAARTELGAEH